VDILLISADSLVTFSDDFGEQDARMSTIALYSSADIFEDIEDGCDVLRKQFWPQNYTVFRKNIHFCILA